jgi:hypothetical protein
MNPRRFCVRSIALDKRRCISILALLILIVLSAKPAAAQGFQVPRSYSVGATPGTVAFADVNGDGLSDMIVSNSSGNSVSVYINSGNGTFQSAANYGTLGSPGSIVVADVNGDGKPDLIVSVSFGVSILLNVGNGTFLGATGYSANPGQVVVGDFNGDGKLDVATSGGSVLLGQGNGSFQQGPSFAGGGSSLVAGDFNGDGKSDLAYVINNSCTNFVDVFLASGNGTLTLAHSYPLNADSSCPSPAALAIGDTNNDGKLDLILSTADGGPWFDPGTGVSILIGNGDGSFATGIVAPAYDDFAAGATWVSVGDFNGDGKLDLAVARPYAGIALYLGNGDGTVNFPTIWGPAASFVASGHFETAEKLDLVGLDSAGNVLIVPGNGDGTFQAQSSYLEGYPTSDTASIAVGDFNGDGKQDIATTSYVEFEGLSSVSTLLGNGNGSFQATTNEFLQGDAMCGSSTGDINGDGKLDLVLAECDAGTVAYLGNGDGTFQFDSPLYFTDNESYGVAVADINGDGKQDVLSTDGTDLNVHLGNGDGTFQAPTSYQTPSGGGFIRVGDFNGDGKADVVIAGNNAISILIGNGNGIFQQAVSYNLSGAVSGDPIGASAIAAGDFNGDGIVDLVVSTRSGINLLLGNGNGTFQAALVVGAGSNGVTAADLNGDGRLDIISAALIANGGLAVLYGNGNGTFQTPVVYGGNIAFDFVKIGDFNGDGATDVAAGAYSQNLFTVFMNVRGTYVTTSTSNTSLEFDQPVTFTASVTASVNGSGTPTGTVSFFDSATLLGTASVESGEATITLPGLSLGTHSIIAAYSGDSRFNPHTASPLTQRVQQAPTTTSIASSANPSIPGQAVTFTATVTSLTSGVPTGAVTFSNGTNITYGVASLNSSGVATLTLINLKPGSDLIGAVYSGDSNYILSASGLLLQLVTRQASTTVLTSSANPITAGQGVTFTATVSSSVGPPKNGDIVTFKNGASILGTSTISSSVATFTTSSLPPGSDMIKATFPGDATLLASTSNVLTETVNNFASTTTLASSANPSSFGQNITFTATVSAVSGGAPGGTVTFKNGAATLGTQNLTGGAATLSTNVLTVGTHSITAIYSGDASHAGSTSSALSQVVNKASTTASLTSSKNPSTFGQSVTLTVTITPSGSGTPTGSVSFKSGTKSLGGVQLASGVATLTTTTLAIGSDTITATYGGSSSFLTSSATMTQVVN